MEAQLDLSAITFSAEKAENTPDNLEMRHQHNFPIYDNVPDYEWNKRRFDYMESDELMRQTDDFMQRIAKRIESGGQINSVFFLDKSARPLAYMFRQLFRHYVPNEAIPQPTILFINVGQEKTIPNYQLEPNWVVAFNGDPEAIRRSYQKWVRPNSRVLVVDEYSSTGESLRQASEMVDQAFNADGVTVEQEVAYSHLPKWYHRPDYIGVTDRHHDDYEEHARHEADRRLGVNYANIRPDEYGRLSTDQVPMNVQLERLEIMRESLKRDQGNVPYARRQESAMLNPARNELKQMCQLIMGQK